MEKPLRLNMSVEDILITQKGMYPFWLFADLHGGKFIGGPYVCFIGAHYEAHFIAKDPIPHEQAVGRLKSGAWKLSEAKDNPSTKIGWGCGKTPQEAFRKACYSSGYLKVKDVT